MPKRSWDPRCQKRTESVSDAFSSLRCVVDGNDSRPLYFSSGSRRGVGWRFLTAAPVGMEVACSDRKGLEGTSVDTSPADRAVMHLFKRSENAILLEQPQSAIGPIDMTPGTTNQRSGTPWNDGTPRPGRSLVNGNDSRPLYFSLYFSPFISRAINPPPLAVRIEKALPFPDKFRKRQPRITRIARMEGSNTNPDHSDRFFPPATVSHPCHP